MTKKVNTTEQTAVFAAEQNLDTQSQATCNCHQFADGANVSADQPLSQTDGVKSAKKSKPKFFSAGNMAVMGILTAISYVLYLLPKFVPIFNLPFFPPWLEIQISDLPALLGGFAIGPWASVIIIVIKCALKMPMTSTSCVGELADIVVGIAFTVPAAIMYRRLKNRKGAIAGMAVGTASAVGVSMLANWLVLIPFYAMQFGNGDSAKGMQTIVGAVSALYDGVNVDNFYLYYLFVGCLPFNLMRCLICAIISYFVYKPLSKALHWEGKRKKDGPTEGVGEQTDDALIWDDATQMPPVAPDGNGEQIDDSIFPLGSHAPQTTVDCSNNQPSANSVATNEDTSAYDNADGTKI